MSDILLYERDLGDGTSLYVYRMLYNDRIVRGPTGALMWNEGWCFVKGEAEAVARAWDGVGDPPETFMVKNLQTGQPGPGMALL